MREKQYSVGSLAKMTGLTIRTLQYYDKIGLLPASRNPENGRRFYTEVDIIRLEQILFYKALGFSLDEIQANLVTADSPAEMRELFLKQEFLLLRKIEQLHTSFAAIDASIKVIDTGKTPPFHVILQFLHLLPGDDIFEWAPAQLDGEQQAALAKYFKTLEDVQHFYHTIKGLLIDALALSQAQVAPSHPLAQKLANQWQEMIRMISKGEPEALEQFASVSQIYQMGGSSSQPLVMEAYTYIDRALEQAGSTLPEQGSI